MKFPKLPKLKVPNWIFNIKIPKIFQKSEGKKSFYAIWKKFIRQVPTDSRTIINGYQHFIVLGTEKSGKTDLIQGLIEQSQDLYPFDTSYTNIPDVQFYLGPNQIIQEVSFATLEDRTIKIRKQIIRLWKKLYARKDPIILIAYNCFSNEHQNLRDLNKLAQLIAGKVSLLSEITKKPLQIRIALTHLDQIHGYLEFARFLKQQNLSFNISVSSNFESNTLASTLRNFYEENLSLMLTTTSNHDFSKILLFSKEMPLLFPTIEEFLRALVARVSFSGSLKLDTLSFTSNQESSTSFIPFQWKKQPSMEIFFRHPMLKHQLASASLCLFVTALILNPYFQQRNILAWAHQGIDQLDLLQFKTFQEEIIPAYTQILDDAENSFLAPLRISFFGEKLDTAKNNLANRMRKHYIEREFRKAILENKGELKCLYFLGLMHTTTENHLGKFILKNSKQVSSSVNIEDNLLRAYVNSCSSPDYASPLFNLDKANPFLALTSFDPWLTYLKRIQDVSTQPLFIEHNFEEMTREADRLLSAINRIKSDPLAFGISTLLEEEKGVQNTSDNIRVIRWLGENLEMLEDFLSFIKQTSTVPLDIEGLNIAQFFAKVKKLATLQERESQTYNFAIGDYLFTFQTKLWVDLVVAHQVERAIQKYIVLNNDTGGSIFFKNTSEAPPPTLPIFNTSFPYFASKISIPGRYSRLEYENKIRSAAEKLTYLVDSLTINPEEKKRFTTFLMQEVISYMKTYQEYYVKFFDSCGMGTHSFDQLKTILKELTSHTSGFHDFLSMVKHHTSAFSDPVLSIKGGEKLNEFAFLNAMLTHDQGEAPYAEYQRIMGDLLQDLERGTSQDSYHEFHPVFSPYLTPATIVSLHILKNDQKSYLGRLNKCLEELKVPRRYQSPFLDPVLALHEIGLRDLKKAIDQIWAAHFYPRIEALIAKFPFNLKGEETVSIEELEEMLNPKGEFYQALDEVIVSYYRNVNLSHLQLDEKISTMLTSLQDVSELLWDKEGNPQPIELNIKSVPFTQINEENPVLVLSYLVIGNESIRNLNQMPSWQKIKVSWWKKDNCSIGVELMNKYTSSKSYKNIQKGDTTWSFFELLREATQDNSNVWSWNIDSSEGNDGYRVSLFFDVNPNELIKIPNTYGNEVEHHDFLQISKNR